MSVEKLVRENIKARDGFADKIKDKSQTILNGLSLSSLDDMDSLESDLFNIGKSFVESHKQEISECAVDGYKLSESINALVADGIKQD